MKRVEIKVGTLCNNHCKFCPYQQKQIYETRPTSQIKKELRVARRDYKHLIFSGGEPMLRVDIFKLAQFARDLGFETIEIKTNGRVFVYKDICKKIIKAGANSFSLSLYGHCSQLHDWLTSSPGSFKQTVQGIRNLKLLNQPVSCETVITKSNYRHLSQIVKILIRLKVNPLFFIFPPLSGQALENFASIMPRFSLVSPYLHTALKEASKKLEVYTQHSKDCEGVWKEYIKYNNLGG